MTTAVRVGPSRAADDAVELLERAREAAAADRHRESIDLYLRAVARDSMIVPDAAIEIGHQYTWAEIPDSAVAWYEVHLSHHPGDVEGELGLARALSWGDRLEEAAARYEALATRGGDAEKDALVGLGKVRAWQEDYGASAACYQRVIEVDPENLEAQLGLAQTLNWSGKHREARDRCEAILARHPDNEDALEGLARAELWAGRPDLAEETLSAAGGTAAEKDQGEIVGTLEAMRGPRFSTFASFRKNTDDGEIRTTGASVAITTRRYFELVGRYSNARLHRTGYPDIDRNEFVVSLSKRLSDLLAVTLSPGYETNRFDPIVVPPGPGEVSSFDLFVWDAYATFFPDDWVRIDLATNRQAMDIPVPVFRRIHVTTESTGLDWRLHYRLVAFSQVMYSAYSDGNSRVALAARLEWTGPQRLPPARRVGLVFLQGAEYSDFAKQQGNGYFSPDSYVHLYGGVRLDTRGTRRLGLRLEGRLGGEKDSGADWASVGSFEGSIRVRVASGAVLGAGYYKSGSRLDSPDGFRAEGVYATLDIGGSP
jgi:thioredoxin-like negative regulator of GroEL